MNMIKQLLVLLMSIMLFSCAGQKPNDLGIFENKFSACPTSPNCVSSDATDKEHIIEVFKLNPSLSNSWKKIHGTVESLSRTRIISYNEQYLHAECSSGVFGFVDDLQLYLKGSSEAVAIKSASRLGYSDFGVNRKRVTDLRDLLLMKKIIVK